MKKKINDDAREEITNLNNYKLNIDKENKYKNIINKVGELNNVISEKKIIKDNKIEELINNGENNNNEKQLFNLLKEKLNKSEIEFRNDK